MDFRIAIAKACISNRWFGKAARASSKDSRKPRMYAVPTIRTARSSCRDTLSHPSLESRQRCHDRQHCQLVFDAVHAAYLGLQGAAVNAVSFNIADVVQDPSLAGRSCALHGILHFSDTVLSDDIP